MARGAVDRGRPKPVTVEEDVSLARLTTIGTGGVRKLSPGRARSQNWRR